MAIVLASPAELVTGRTLDELEAVIERGLGTFFDVGMALMEIREGKKYRERECHTFEEYCQKRWDFSRPYAYNLIDAAQVLSAMADKTLPAPANERQARMLVALKDDPTALTAAWREVLKRAPKDGEGRPVVTAALVKSVVAERTGAAPAPEELPPLEDDTEAEAPESLVNALASCERIAALAARIAKRLRGRSAAGYSTDEANELLGHLEAANHWMVRADRMKPQRGQPAGAPVAEWSAEDAYAALVALARQQADVHTDDLAAAYSLPAPQPNAIGYLWQRAKKEGVLEETGETRPTKQPGKNGHRYPVYRSLVFKGV